MALSDEQMIERLRGIYDAFNRGDYDAAAEWAHPDIVLVRTGGLPAVRGVEAVRAWAEPDAFESQVVELEELQASGNKVLVRIHSRARGAGSGIEMDVRAWTVWTFGDDGRITRAEIFPDHQEDQALAALQDG